MTKITIVSVSTEEGSKVKTFEFQSTVDQGNIPIPPEYSKKMKGIVRVIVLAQEQDVQDNGQNFLTYRMKHPYQVKDFTPLTRDEAHDRRSQ